MKQLSLFLPVLFSAAITSVGMAGPVDGAMVFQDEVISPSRPFERTLTFKSNVRAGVLAENKLKESTKLIIEIKNSQGELVTKDDYGGGIVSVIWYPPKQGAYTIIIKNAGTKPAKCYIAVR